MEEILFIGDELTASAYRLAGIRTRIVGPEETRAALDESDESRLILLASTHARALGDAELMARIKRGKPMLMVVSDAAGTAAIPDFATRLRRSLGVAT